ALLNAGLGRGIAGLDRANDFAPVLGQAEWLGDVFVERLGARGEMCAPRAGRCARRSASMTGRAASAGIARPMPTDAPVGEISAELTPMTLPLRSNIGPPLLPMLIAASVWMSRA